MTLDVAVIGTGPEPEQAGGIGYAMGYRHASAYHAIDDCELIACADIERANAEAFADHYGVDDRRVYEDHESMLAEAEPDLVSVCTPVTTHADIVADCAAAGVEAIHCEKPMAHTWADCKRMVETCEEAGVALTINHQRRFAGPFRQAKHLLDDGAIGKLERVELGGKNLYDFGTHMFDMCHYVTDGTSPEWVRAIVVYDEENVRYGVHNENRAMAEWEYENGVEGFAETGSADRDCLMRLEGEEGTIEIGHSNGASLRTKAADESEWTRIDTGGERVSHVAVDPGLPVKVLRKLDDATPGPQVFRPLANRLFMADEDPFLKPYVRRALQEVVDATTEGRESPLAARNALESTELIFGCWESARQQGRVELPLEIEDNPLTAMVNEGRFRPN